MSLYGHYFCFTCTPQHSGITSCYSNGSIMSQRSCRKYRYVAFARWRGVVTVHLHLIDHVRLDPRSPHRERNLGHFSRFCGAHSRGQQTQASFQSVAGGSSQAALWNEAQNAEVWGRNAENRVRGEVPEKTWFWCISRLKKSSNLDVLQLVGRFQFLELCKKFISQPLGVHTHFQHPRNDALVNKQTTTLVRL